MSNNIQDFISNLINFICVNQNSFDQDIHVFNE